ncbi:hypothetical protein BH23ACT12_BH23ACT12_22970 [soil metagenome]
MDPVIRPVPDRGSIFSAALWMIGLSLALLWLPVLGPGIAGFVGGMKARTMGKAMVAALVPAILLGAVVGLVLLAFDLPLIGTIAGIGVFIAILVQDVPMFIGAALGAGLGR